MTSHSFWTFVSIVSAFITGWGFSGLWRGTTKRGYLLALDHVEQATSGRITGRPLPEALAKLRDEVAGD